MDLSRIPTEELQALRAGNLSKVSKGSLLDIKHQQSSLPADVVNEPGLIKETGPITDALMLGVGGIPEAGASALPLAARVGENILKTPQRTIEGIAAIPSAIKEAGSVAKTAASEGISKLQSLADALLGQGKEAATVTANEMTAPARQVVQDTTTALKGAANPTPDLLAAQKSQAELGFKYDQKTAQLTDMKKTAGQAIGDVEKANGLEFKELPDNFQKVLRNKELLGQKANSMARLADKGPEFLSQNLSPQTIQVNRKLAQTALKTSGLDDLTRVQLAKANSVFGQALGNQIPDLSEKLSAFRDIDQALKALPTDKKTEADALRVSIQRITANMKTNKMALQDKLQMANEALDNISRQAETLIQQGTKRDLRRNIIKKIGIGATIAAGAPSVIKHL